MTTETQTNAIVSAADSALAIPQILGLSDAIFAQALFAQLRKSDVRYMQTPDVRIPVYADTGASKEARYYTSFVVNDDGHLLAVNDDGEMYFSPVSSVKTASAIVVRVIVKVAHAVKIDKAQSSRLNIVRQYGEDVLKDTEIFAVISTVPTAKGVPSNLIRFVRMSKDLKSMTDMGTEIRLHAKVDGEVQEFIATDLTTYAARYAGEMVKRALNGNDKPRDDRWQTKANDKGQVVIDKDAPMGLQQFIDAAKKAAKA